MKKQWIAVLLLVAIGSAAAHDGSGSRSGSLWPSIAFKDDLKINMRHRSVVIVPKHRRDGRVEIRSDHSLAVDGREVAVDASARELTGAYYDLVDSIYREAKRIGGEGAKVGVQGAKIGLRAVAGVFRMVLPDYDSNDLERDIEKEKIKLEDRAQRLEARAERLEDKVHELERLHDDLKDSVPELGELEWF